jgi:hypothetical protein
MSEQGNAAKGKKRVAEEDADADAKKKKRAEDDATRGARLIDTVRRSYLEDPSNMAPIYEVWSILICTNTFAQCTRSGLRDPSDARVKALEFVQSVFLKERENGVGHYLQNSIGLSSLSKQNFSGDKGQCHIEIEVDILTGTWIRRGEDAGAPKTEILVFICKHTGKRLGSTGSDFISSPDTIVKDQTVCIMNLFRGHVAFLTTSPFFDAKKNNKRINAEADIEHAIQTVRAQIAGSIEACYDEAVDASLASLDLMCKKRAELRLPETVEKKQRELEVAIARLDTHTVKFSYLFVNDDSTTTIMDDEDDELVKDVNKKIKEDFHRLHDAYTIKTNCLMEHRQKAEVGLQQAMESAKDMVAMIDELDFRIEEHKRKYYFGDDAKKKDEMYPVDFGKIVDHLLEELVENVVEKEYYAHFRNLLYLFDNHKTLPALVQQLKLIISNDSVRTEACMAFVIGVNEHFRCAAQ